MKKVLLSISILSSVLTFAQTTKYDGNGKNGFGGAIGRGSFEITDKGDSVCFLLTRGPGNFDSTLVFYIDGIEGGITTTANLAVGTDIYSTAVTGKFSATQKSVLNFPSGFQPDFSVVFNKDGGKILFFEKDAQGNDIITVGAPVILTPAGNNASATYSGTVAKADVSISGPVNFKLIGTYIGSTASRSNEGFGESFDAFDNANLNASYTTATYLNYSSTSSLPVTITDLKALNIAGKVQLKWSVAQEINIDAYDVQRSADGTNFSTISTVAAKNASTNVTYSYNDETTFKGITYYRLVIKEKGRTEVSKVVAVKSTVNKNSFKVQQAGRSLNIRLNDMEAGKYNLVVLSSNGQVMQKESLQHTGIDATKQVSLNSSVVSGIYRILLQSDKVNLIQSIHLR